MKVFLNSPLVKKLPWRGTSSEDVAARLSKTEVRDSPECDSRGGASDAQVSLFKMKVRRNEE